LTLHILHPSCYSCYQPCEQWRMMKGLDCDYETLNITMVICDTYILQRLTKSWWWRQTFEMITTTSPLVTLITLAQMYNTYLLHTRGHANCRRWSCWTREWHVTVDNKSNKTGATCGASTAYPSGAHAFTPGFEWGSCCSIFRFLCNVL
jgi:hypothetical protein